MATSYILLFFKLLEGNTEVFISDIPAEMLERVYQNWTMRMDYLKRSRGQHLHAQTFKH